MNEINWVFCDSKSDLRARLSSVAGKQFEELITDEANTWGYLAIEKSSFIPIGYTDFGVSPQVRIYNKIVIIGVSDTVTGFNLDTGKLNFKYKMPTVFHEFIIFHKDNFIVQDEVGFVCLSYDGSENWVRLCDDVIETYQLRDSSIYGKTIEGNEFDFKVLGAD
jgi:hypothetical protein